MSRRCVWALAMILAAGSATAVPPEGGAPTPGHGALRGEPGSAGKPPSPDLVLILLDEVGFAGLGAFGGRVETPHIDRLAREGLRYTAFNVAPVGGATRAALLSGRNPESLGMAEGVDTTGRMAERGGALPAGVPLLPAILKAHGYATFALGQWQLTPAWAASAAAGHFEHWPTGRGFDHFYGWLSPWTHPEYPELYRDTTPVSPPRSPDEGYHVSEDLVDSAIRYIDDLRSADPSRPYFLYLALGAAGAPQQAPRRYRELYRGRFAQGWDRERDMILERQKAFGVVPPDARPAPRDPAIPPWDALDPERRSLYQAFMENYAGYLTHADAQIGRLVEHLRGAGRLDNTLVLVLSAHGASPTGGPDGVLNRVAQLNGVVPTVAEMAAHRDRIGTPASLPLAPWGWAALANLPFRGGAGAPDNGGIRVPLVLYWPRGITSVGTVRRQWQFVTDIVPTVLDILQIPKEAAARSALQASLHGRSFIHSLADPEAPSSHDTQFWARRDQWAIYHRGWKASTSSVDRASGTVMGRWHLYHLDKDLAEVEDLAAAQPAKLAEMVARFFSETGRYRVFPLEEGASAPPAGEPAPSRPRLRQWAFFPPMSPLPEALAPNLFGKSYTVTVFLGEGGRRSQGVLAAQGGIGGGWVLYVRDGRPRFVYNFLGSARAVLESAIELPEGRAVVRYRFVRQRARQGVAELYVDGRKAGELAIERVVPETFGNEPLDVGQDSQSPVDSDYRPPFPYSGRIERVELRLDD